MALPTRKRDPEATRRSLLRAAAALFSRNGYDGTTTDAMATEAGANKAMISYHFGGKKGLYTAVLAECLDASDLVLEPVRSSSSSSDERLGQFIELFMEFIARHPHFPLIVLREQMAGGVHLEGELQERFFGFFRLVRSILEDGRRDGTFRDVDPHAAHLSLVGSMVFYAATRNARRRLSRKGKLPAPAPEDRAYARHVRELFLRGLRSELPGKKRRGTKP
jgi:AcrR family transcriptional regulator